MSLASGLFQSSALQCLLDVGASNGIDIKSNILFVVLYVRPGSLVASRYATTTTTTLTTLFIRYLPAHMNTFLSMKVSWIYVE